MSVFDKSLIICLSVLLDLNFLKNNFLFLVKIALSIILGLYSMTLCISVLIIFMFF